MQRKRGDTGFDRKGVRATEGAPYVALTLS
jgi:hypothetical protein